MKTILNGEQINLGGGHGLPLGGTAGQILAKASDADYDAEWKDGVTQEQLSAKQDKLTGKVGQMVGFTTAGSAVAQDMPQSGMTQAEADGRYLKLTGGQVTGSTKFQILCAIDSLHIGASDEAGRVYMNAYRIDAGTVGLDIMGNLGDEPVRLSYIADPKEILEAANKRYVDTSIQEALGSIEAALASI